MSGATGGSFGSNENRGTRVSKKTENEKEKRVYRDSNSVVDFFERISPENWVDIICCTLIVIFLIVVACNWQEFSEWLFKSILFPIIDIGAKVVAFVTTIAAVIGAIVLKFRRKRRRRWFW